jgi:hypothetical protein
MNEDFESSRSATHEICRYKVNNICMANYAAVIIGKRSPCLGAVSGYQQNIIRESVVIHQKYN